MSLLVFRTHPATLCPKIPHTFRHRMVLWSLRAIALLLWKINGAFVYKSGWLFSHGLVQTVLWTLYIIGINCIAVWYFCRMPDPHNNTTMSTTQWYAYRSGISVTYTTYNRVACVGLYYTTNNLVTVPCTWLGSWFSALASYLHSNTGLAWDPHIEIQNGLESAMWVLSRLHTII